MSEVQKTELLNPHSVEISKGQTGKVGFTVKCYGDTIENCSNNALAAFEQLHEKFPSVAK